MRKQEIAIFINKDGSMGYFALGTETPEQCTKRLMSEGCTGILVIEVKLAYWGA